MEISALGPDDHDDLLALWEDSVRASHHFLSEEDIAFLRPVVRNDALPNLVLRGVRDPGGGITGFIGVSGDSVEALFVSPDAFGRGIGSALMHYAEKHFGACKVDVNEQNLAALGFYRHLGYKVAGRSPLDGQGRPFPLLHLEKKS